MGLRETFSNIGETAKASAQSMLRETAANFVPGGQTALSAVSKFVEKSRDSEMKKLHKKKPRTAANTVTEDEFKLASKNLGRQGKTGPWQFLVRVVRWLVPGGTTPEQDHTKAIDELKAFASQHDAQNFAYEAVNTLLVKAKARFKQKVGFFRRLFGFHGKIKDDKIFNSYIDAIKAWTKALDLKDPAFVKRLEELRDRVVNDDSLPEFVRSTFKAKHGETLGSFMDELLSKSQQDLKEAERQVAMKRAA